MTLPAHGRGTSQRSPTVLVSDSRDQQPTSTIRKGRPSGTRFITVDNVLQYASDVPSMQQRHPAPISRSRRLVAAIGNGGASSATASSIVTGKIGRLAAQPRLPPRTTKFSEKLVLLPDTSVGGSDDSPEDEDDEDDDVELVDEELVARLAHDKHIDPEVVRQQLLVQKRLGGDFGVDNDFAPMLADEETLRKRRIAPEKSKSYAERLPKARRTEKLARVTAYCTAQAYKMQAVTSFVKEWHGARTKLYDDCIYAAYHLPLLPGHDGYRLRSSPVLKVPGGKSLLDEEIERNEQRDHHDDYIGEAEDHSVGGYNRPEDEHNPGESPQDSNDHHTNDEQHKRFLDHISQDGNRLSDEQERNGDKTGTDEAEEPAPRPRRHSSDDGHTLYRERPSQVSLSSSSSIPPAPARTFYNVAEMFVFSYGVVVFWNFTERQEKDLLADLAFATSSVTGISIPLAMMPLQEEDFETEDFHFEYSTDIARPRVYNDMITLRSSDHMIKLAISHGISQSTKLSFFEEVMARQMSDAKDIPRRLATTGQLGMKREDVFRILGRLFKSRVEVNLSSNMLDVPNFFWESEPTLYPLYIAVREYLEIKPRILVLNERCRVFLDLAEILSDAIADSRTSHQTWIVIVLILLSIFVTLFEVFLRFGLLHARQGAVVSPLTLVARTILGSRSVSSASSGWSPNDIPPGCVCPSISPGGDVNVSGMGLGL
ncbi:hypothetical protein N7495_009103 [Penicillium taxi]|uniref:uncharacterized protein n=1 Tax=Penicillium taxi TaxID=168475 RepID=UPI002544F81D|nr:uncharacterized protein N7495_009103 [Penicillium taxi]KAJ5889062.1 hypothetical protein N7495_009103 [Penicillium taxi]